MNSSINSASNVVLAARAEASAWITQLHGPNRSAEMERGFQRWLAERPENSQEFEGLTEIWDSVAGGVPARGVPRLERWEHSAEVRELKALREKYEGRRPRPRRLLAAAALLLVGLLVYGLWPATSYTTAVGEQRVVQLEDGTQVSLNSDTKMTVDYGKRARRIRLEKGEALFQVSKDSRRPFTVTAGDNSVVALGTSFLVRLHEGRTAITLIEGKVAVSSESSSMLASASNGEGLARASNKVRNAKSASPSVRSSVHPSPSNGEGLEMRNGIVLSPGERLTLAAGSSPKLDAPQLDRVTAWRRGEVVLNDTPLVEAVAEMNRYDKTPIVIADAAIEQWVVSGLYHTGDSEGFARSLVKMYPLEIIDGDGQIRLRRK